MLKYHQFVVTLLLKKYQQVYMALLWYTVTLYVVDVYTILDACTHNGVGVL